MAAPAEAQAPLKITPQASSPQRASPPQRAAPRRVQKKPATRRVAPTPEPREAVGKRQSTPSGVKSPDSPIPATPSAPAAAPPPAAAAAAAGPGADLAFGAYQRGHYLTAFAEATKRVDAAGDPKAMALLGELYANGFGVPRDDRKAAEWYALAADRGDREAMFALAMFRLGGRVGARDRDGAVTLLGQAAKLGHVAAAYDLALLHLENQDFARAAELLKTAADAGSPEAQYALATLYKEGRGVPQDRAQATRLMAAASRTGNVDAEVEYAIALFNGDGTPADEAAAAALLLKAARKGSPIAQNRLARVLAAGRGMAANPVEAAKWHLIARARGESDPWLEGFLQKLTPEQRQASEKSADAWLKSLPPSPPSRS
jgi:TPR repeat protein